jgi:four helix bundle protein
MARKLEDLPIHSNVVAFWRAVNALLDKPRLRRDRSLHGQISRANDSIPSNMVEGFEQGTDRAFANFLTYSKGSLAEVLKRLKQAYFKRYITSEELQPHLAAGEELARCWEGLSSICGGVIGRIVARTTRRHQAVARFGISDFTDW